jgi:hypothetical protein
MPRWCSSMRPPQDDGAAQDRQPLAPPGPVWSEERVNPAYAAVCRSRLRVSRRRSPQALSWAAVGQALGSHRPRPPRRARQWREDLIRDEHPLAIADDRSDRVLGDTFTGPRIAHAGQSYARAATVSDVSEIGRLRVTHLVTDGSAGRRIARSERVSDRASVAQCAGPSFTSAASTREAPALGAAVK